jgi:hypothetical protein
VNETTRCEFISAITYGVVSIFDGTVKVYPHGSMKSLEVMVKDATATDIPHYT